MPYNPNSAEALPNLTARECYQLIVDLDDTYELMKTHRHQGLSLLNGMRATVFGAADILPDTVEDRRRVWRMTSIIMKTTGASSVIEAAQNRTDPQSFADMFDRACLEAQRRLTMLGGTTAAIPSIPMTVN